MKKNSILWAVLPMMAAALMTTACSNEDSVVETPAQQKQNGAKTIPYTVTVNEGATTRATVESDNQTLYFADGDKLYITGTNIQGVLDIQTGSGTASATFSGDLNYTGSGTPTSDLPLTATLVSAQQTVGNEVSVDGAGAVTVNYPTTTYCSSVNDAVQKYSRLTGTSPYGEKSFSLTQQTAFLNFEINFADGTTTGTALSAVVSNNSSAIATANVTTVTESEKVVAKFVLPVASGTTLSSATVTMGSKAAISFGASQTLTGKVYNVKKTQYTMAAAATDGDKYKLICTDGHIHADKADAECKKARVAKIIYIGTTGHYIYNHGLALALKDASTGAAWCSQDKEDCLGSYENEEDAKEDMAGIANTDALVGHTSHTHTAASAARNYNSGTHPTETSEWFLPSVGQWQKMIDAAGGYSALKTNAELESGATYWSSTQYSYKYAWALRGVVGWDKEAYKPASLSVRAALAF